MNRGHWGLTWSSHTAKPETLEMLANADTIPENADTHCWCGQEKHSFEFAAVEEARSTAMGKKTILRFGSHYGLFLRALASGRNIRESEEICLDSGFHQHLSYCRNDAFRFRC